MFELDSINGYMALIFVRYEQTSIHPMELTRINERKLIFSVNFYDIVKTFFFLFFFF